MNNDVKTVYTVNRTLERTIDVGRENIHSPSLSLLALAIVPRERGYILVNSMQPRFSSV